MTKIILCGCNGKMGHVISKLVEERNDCVIVAGVDIRTDCLCGYQVYSKISDITAEADVIVDFSHPSLLSDILDYAEDKNMPVVICSTGYSDSQVAEIKAAAEKLPVFYSRNMSLGINLLISLARKATNILGESFDIEIVEKHHNQKIDAPSGTALMIADAISEERTIPSRYEYDRHSVRRKREKEEIGIHAIRGGTIVGEHDVIFAGHDEVLTISHSAGSKGVFAAGAVNAAVFMKGQKAGLYDMNDMIG